MVKVIRIVKVIVAILVILNLNPSWLAEKRSGHNSKMNCVVALGKPLSRRVYVSYTD